MRDLYADKYSGLQLTWNTGAIKKKVKSLNKEQTTTPQVHYKPWCGLLQSLLKHNL